MSCFVSAGILLEKVSQNRSVAPGCARNKKGLTTMNFISVKEAAERWEISQTLVRRYCGQNRIPHALYVNGVWLIPERAKKPVRLNPDPKTQNLPPLARKLIRQKTKKSYHGLYDYVQVNLAYSSSRMASNRLTREQVESIFQTGKVRESFEPMKVSDLVEVMNHCVCVDYILDHLGDSLTQKFIQHLHYLLMFGTVDHRLKRVTPGAYRTDNETRRTRAMAEPGKINTSISLLIKEYEAQKEIGLSEILSFHVEFENIVPFDDGNGRVGRLIMFKECLRHGVLPFILDDKNRSNYLNGLKDWPYKKETLMRAVEAAQNRFERQMELHQLREYRQYTFTDDDG